MTSKSEEPSNRNPSEALVNSPKLDSIWSLRPVWIWMKFMGYDLDLSEKSTVLRGYWNWFFGCTMLSLTLVYSGLKIFQSMKNVHTFSANTQSWNLAIIDFQEISSAIGIHLSTFVVSHWYWKPLWKCIRLMDRSMTFQDAYYYKLRKFSFIVLLGIMLVS